MSIARRLTFANVMSVIAVFIALGGTVYGASSLTGKAIKKNSEPGNRIKKNSLTGKQVKESSLGIVPNASKLQGKGASAFASASIEAPHVVGASGEPAYTNNWGPAQASTDEGVSFYKDPYGIVHLQGDAANGVAPSTATIFTLPPGYRPAKDLFYPAYSNGGALTTVGVTAATGAVTPTSAATSYIGLSTVTFRAGV